MSDRFDLAIWLQPSEPSSNQGENSEISYPYISEGIQVHLNFWKLPKYKSIDIGINFPTITNGSIFLFINSGDSLKVEDISESFEKSDIRNIVFNEFMDVKSCPEQCTCWITQKRLNESCEKFCICGIGKEIDICKKYDGKLVKINISNKKCINNQCKCNKQYIRLRLTGDAIHNLYLREKMPCSRLEYYTSTIEFLDFRLNNVRSLPGKLIQSIKSFPVLNKVRCLLMLDGSEEVILYNKTYKKIRSIEKDRWLPYLTELKSYQENSKKIILAYQWNSEETVQDFSLFTKIKVNRFTFRTLLLYLIIITLVNLVPQIPGIIKYLFDKLLLGNQA